MNLKKYSGFLMLIVLAGLSSCLKESPALDPKETNNVVEIYSLVPTPTTSPADAVYPLYTQSFDIVPSAEFKVQVSYSGAEVAPEDITVTLGVDAQALNDYNDEQGTSMVFMPAAFYSVDSWTVKIPKGQRLGTMTVTFKPSSFDPTKSYGFPVKILSSSLGKISSNYGTVIYAIGAKNKYDGIYQLRGFHNRPGLDAPYNEEVYMITSGPNSIYMYWPPAGVASHPLNGGVTYYGSFTTNFYFDVATNALTNWDLKPFATTVTPSMGPATTSRYDPATKKIYAQFYYNANPAARGFSDTLTYLRAR
jgi:hypothetical protein